MKNHYIKLFNYDNWATNRLIVAAESVQNDPKLKDLISHVITARIVWLGRIKTDNSSTTPWNPRELSENILIFNENQANWEVWLNQITETDLRGLIHYKNIKGDPFSGVLKDILTHLINHSTYHRGQIATRLKELGVQVPPTDFIVFTREEKK